MNKNDKSLTEELEKKMHEQEQLEHRRQRAANRAEYLSNKERRDRTHRLVTRGAALESIIPKAKGMGERAFYLALEEFFKNEEIRGRFCDELEKQKTTGKEGE